MDHEPSSTTVSPASPGFGLEAYSFEPSPLERVTDPPTSPTERIEGASTSSRTRTIALAALWSALANRSLVILGESYSEYGNCVTLSHNAFPQCNTSTWARDLIILRRTLTGEPRKVIASDFKIGQPTVSLACASVLQSFGLGPSVARAPLLLLMAANAASNVELSPGGASALLTKSGQFLIVRVACPGEAVALQLPNSERSVMRLFIRGETRAQIALNRLTTERTVANQLNAVFRKLRVSGRNELVKRLSSSPVPTVFQPHLQGNRQGQPPDSAHLMRVGT